MFARRLKVVSLLFGCLDALLAVLAFASAYWLRSDFLPNLTGRFPSLPSSGLYSFSSYLPLLSSVVVIWLASGYLLGVYRPRELRETRQALLDPTMQAVAGTVVLAAGLFFVKGFHISRLLVLFFVVLNWFFQAAVRLAYIEWGPRLREWLGEAYQILLVGTGEAARQLAAMIHSSRADGLRLVGFIATSPAFKEKIDDFPVWDVGAVPRLLREKVIDEVIFAVGREELGSLEDLFLLCEEEGVRTRVQLQVFPHQASQVFVEHFGPVPLLTFSTTPENEMHLLLKRVLDLAGAVVLLVLLSPLLVILAALVKLTSPGPVLYRQTRCGLGGRRFTLVKFRSMAADAEQRQAELAALNEADGPVFKMRNDPRVTPLGRAMRKLSLDELPQLWNVLKGDMSFVGPRPPLPHEVEKYERWQRRRLRMRPGLTCLWALEGRSDLSFSRWMELDMAYIDNWSLWLDLKIFLKTIPRVLLGRGAA
ncbi:MAG TPA: sugar transferase [Candidatus Acidoferrales bacterium]|nr:sugar transferase [Candidatus Acidoferrales bacterium]